LYQAIAAALEEGGQVILLLNRRGFSTHIQCPDCGQVLRCPACDIALTHHRTDDTALCHYCNYHITAPRVCPGCQSPAIRYSGLGTQRLEAEVRARFPNVPCLRMDSDTMRGHGSHERAFAEFRSGKARILLGTQMIAKGLDFPNVTLVGVIQADTALHLPDFRAAERTFHLVTQVAGRTGRGSRGGQVLVQTLNPEHPAIRAAARHDFAAFAAYELPIRRMFQYPPFAAMIRLVIRSEVEEAARKFALCFGQRLTAALEARQAAARVLGPAPAPLARLRGYCRFQIQLQGPDGQKLRDAVWQAAGELDTPEGVQWIADVDPVNML
jgi:primosomal protein N' (replication factor Y)